MFPFSAVGLKELCQHSEFGGHREEKLPGFTQPGWEGHYGPADAALLLVLPKPSSAVHPAMGTRLCVGGPEVFTESQNHRMLGVGRDLCGSPSPTPCRSRVTQSRPQRTLSRWVLNISREGDSTASLGSLGQGSVTLRGKKFFLIFRRNFLCLSLCPLPLVLSLGTTEI